MMQIQYFTTIRTQPILSKQVVHRIVTTVSNAESVSDQLLSVHMVGQHRMRSLNRQYRGVDAPTDVLSFEAGDEWWGDAPELGDIFLCQPYILAQAKRFDVSAKEEMTRMLIHGMLHLLGYDHDSDTHAADMFGRQERYVQASTRSTRATI